jgi:hypothetical protein
MTSQYDWLFKETLKPQECTSIDDADWDLVVTIPLPTIIYSMTSMPSMKDWMQEISDELCQQVSFFRDMSPFRHDGFIYADTYYVKGVDNIDTQQWYKRLQELLDKYRITKRGCQATISYLWDTEQLEAVLSAR